MDIILAFWLSGWVMIMYRLFIPAFRICKMIDPQNLVVHTKWLTFGIVGIMALLLVPLLMYPTLSNNRERFVKEFCTSLLGKK